MAEVNHSAVTEEFKENVRVFTEMDNEIRKKKKEIKELEKIRKEVENLILKHMDIFGITSLEINGGKLIKNKYETKVALKKDTIKNSILAKVKDPVAVNDIIETMESNRETKERVNLKRTFSRTSN